MYCVETNNLSHQFAAGVQVLNSINLKVPQGSIYGFLGPNGAGKTTTLRLLLGLIKKQKGEISIFGRPLHQQRIEILKKLGSLIESPSLYAQLTAKENLQVWQKIYGCSNSRLTEVLRTVGIPNTGSKKVSQFSLGMKQRLSIAVALLNNPSLLILDEPTNGLDPYGIIEIRDLLKKLNEEQDVTIIISSHLLAEVEKLVTHVGIISNGTLMFQDTLVELTNKQFSSSKTILHTSDQQRSADIIHSLAINSREENGRLLLPVLPAESVASLNRQLVQEGIDVYEISTVRKDLETIFMDLINQAS